MLQPTVSSDSIFNLMLCAMLHMLEHSRQWQSLGWQASWLNPNWTVGS